MRLDLPRVLARLVLPGLVLACSACTLVRVDSHGAPPSIQSHGLIDGHVAVGIPAEDQLLRASLFDGRSPGAVGELVIWKLLRVEVGLAGAAIGIGPFDLALGVLAYEPRLPDYVEHEPEPADDDGPSDGEPEPYAEPGS